MNHPKSVIFLFLLFSFISCISEKETTKRSADYLGETPPDSIAQLFAPGFVSTGMYTRDLAMTPDGNEIYFCVDIGRFSYMTILQTKRVNGVWTEPEVAPFALDLRYRSLEPFITPDGKKFFFASNRPKDGSEKPADDTDLWVMDRQGDGWGEPYNLGSPVNSDAPEFFPSLTSDGTLYFTRDDLQTRSSVIFRSRLQNGQYTEPERLNDKVNAGRSRFNAFIAPDESYLIVPIFGYPGSFGGTDYYICFRSPDDQWSDPINLGAQINTESGSEYSPYVSPDGKYFFFMGTRKSTVQQTVPAKMSMDDLKQIYNRPENGNADIYWVDTSFIDRLRPAN